jgi:ribosomal protein S18 acetylase RimI-like enzyme
VSISYTESLAGIDASHLSGFFVDWPRPLSPEAHLRVLHGSATVVLAIKVDSGRVVGFVTALTDGELSAFIPLLEVLPEYQGQGIGTELMHRMLARLADVPNIDLMCDPELIPFYTRFGLLHADGMISRRHLREGDN